MRLIRLVTALALVGAVVVGCSSDEQPQPEPKQPSAEELYCEAFRDYYERSSRNAEKDDAEVIASMKTFASEASRLEIPESMSAEVRAGLATWISLIDEVPADANQGQVAALEQNLSPRQVKQLDAWNLCSNARCLSRSAN